MKLLEAVMAMVTERGFRVGNADITIVAQKPKLAGYMAQMKANIARGLNVDEDRVNVKATTTEHMGFEGEELGISSTAAVIICKQA
jgi:2-C-methyl-D-erythritol 2,4-cyclodiphosphate synthase